MSDERDEARAPGPTAEPSGRGDAHPPAEATDAEPPQTLERRDEAIAAAERAR